jgi:hypothetical protein
MKNIFAPFLMLLVMVALLTACASTPYVPPSACEGQDSLILSTIDDPRALSKGLLAVNLVAMEGIEGYGPADAIAVLDKIEADLDALDLTYAALVAYVLAKIQVANALAGAALFIAGDEIDRLNQPLPISPCDLALIRLHLQKQRMLVSIYAAGGKG